MNCFPSPVSRGLAVGGIDMVFGKVSVKVFVVFLCVPRASGLT